MSETPTNAEILEYIKHNPLMVLSTVDAKGHPHGAAVYVCALEANRLYFVTKADTQKFKNLTESPNVGVTIVNAEENSTLQANGRASVVENAEVIGEVMKRMTKIYAKSTDWLPPVAKLKAGPYEVVCVTTKHTRLAAFQGAKAGSERIFKEK